MVTASNAAAATLTSRPITTTEPGASHVGIAVGGDEFVHAPSSTGVVRVESLEAPLKERFGPLAVKNFNALKVAYDATNIEERQP